MPAAAYPSTTAPALSADLTSLVMATEQSAAAPAAVSTAARFGRSTASAVTSPFVSVQGTAARFGSAAGLVASSAYGEVQTLRAVETKSQHEIVMLLLNGAITEMGRFKVALDARKVTQAGEACSRALRIVGEGLKGTLDMSQGGDIAQNLDDLYGHVCKLLIKANIDGNPDLITQAGSIMVMIKEAWAGIADAPQAAA